MNTFYEDDTREFSRMRHSSLRRLMGYIIPQWKLFSLACVLLLASSALQLLVPYLFKTGIDNYLAVMYYPYTVTEDLQNEIHTYIADENAYISPVNTQLFLRTKAYEKLPENLRLRLNEPHTDPPTPVYIFPTDGRDIPSVGTRADDYLIVSQDELSSLSPQILSSLRTHDSRGIIRIALAVFLVILLTFGVDYGNIITVQIAGQRAMHQLRVQLFAHIEHLSLPYFDRMPIGKLVTRVTNDIESLNEMFSGVLVNLTKEIVLFFGTLIVLFLLNARLAAISLLLLPIFIVVTLFFRKYVRAVSHAIRRAVAQLNATLTEDIAGSKIITVFERKRIQREAFSSVNEKCYSTHMNRIMIFAIFNPLVDLLTSASIALVIIFGGFSVISGAFTLGTLVAFLMYVRRLFGPLFQMAQQYNVIQSAIAASERVFETLDLSTDVIDPRENPAISTCNGRVECTHVSFAYTKDTPVLRDVSFRIEPGQSVAIVGPTGAGKSSIINLLCRFHDPTSGTVLLDDIDLKKWPFSRLRKHIAIVLQDAFIFSRSVKDNIRLGCQDITDENIRHAAEMVQIHDFIESLPHGYDEVMTERGATLSAGQRQLICFARALAHNPALLILDEATSSVDPATEVKLQHAINTLLYGRTSLIVAHRLSTIKRCDSILVLDNGYVVEQGTHDELMAKRGFYYNLYLIQFSGLTSATA